MYVCMYMYWHVHLANITGCYALLCHHLCSGRQQATDTFSLYIQSHIRWSCLHSIVGNSQNIYVNLTLKT